MTKAKQCSFRLSNPTELETCGLLPKARVSRLAPRPKVLLLSRTQINDRVSIQPRHSDFLALFRVCGGLSSIGGS